MLSGCGVSVAKQQTAQRRIVGGDEAGFGSFPWQVIITFLDAVQEKGAYGEESNIEIRKF